MEDPSMDLFRWNEVKKKRNGQCDVPYKVVAIAWAILISGHLDPRDRQTNTTTLYRDYGH